MNILITGTSSGIGKGCAEYFLKEGHLVYGFDKDTSTISHPAYTHFCLDIRDKSAYPKLSPVDIVINNAGVQDGDDIDVNLKGTISITEHYAIHPAIHDHDRFCQRTHWFRISGICSQQRRRSRLHKERRHAHCSLSGHLQQPGLRWRLNRAEPPGDGRPKALESNHGAHPAETVDDCRRSCTVDLFHGCDQPLLHRAEYPD